MRRITAADVSDEIRRLEDAGYRVPDTTDSKRLAATWIEVLGDYPGPDDLTEAVTAYIREGGRFFPRPAEIRSLAVKARRERGGWSGDSGSLAGRYRKWEQSQEGGCPVCGATMQLLTPAQMGAPERADTWHSTWGRTNAKRYGVLHDPAQHFRVGVPHVGFPDVPPSDGGAA